MPPEQPILAKVVQVVNIFITHTDTHFGTSCMLIVLSDQYWSLGGVEASYIFISNGHSMEAFQVLITTIIDSTWLVDATTTLNPLNQFQDNNICIIIIIVTGISLFDVCLPPNI